jgi:hypothetical protein
MFFIPFFSFSIMNVSAIISKSVPESTAKSPVFRAKAVTASREQWNGDKVDECTSGRDQTEMRGEMQSNRIDLSGKGSMTHLRRALAR